MDDFRIEMSVTNKEIDYYFIIIYINKKAQSSDSAIAKFLGMTMESYQTLIKSKFKCGIMDDEIYLLGMSEAERFRKWFEENMDYYLIMKELSPNILIGGN